MAKRKKTKQFQELPIGAPFYADTNWAIKHGFDPGEMIKISATRAIRVVDVEKLSQIMMLDEVVMIDTEKFSQITAQNNRLVGARA